MTRRRGAIVIKGGMADVVVSVHQVAPRILAAVRREVTIGEVASAWRAALDQVWQFLRTQPGLHAGGHNVFLYHHPSHRSAPMPVDFGIEVTRPFEASGDVRATQTPAGEVALATHVGPYHRLKETHDAIHAWAARDHRSIGGHSWEIYGDFTEDESKLETTVVYLLA